MRFSDNIDKLVPALRAVQLAIKPLIKDGHNTDIGNRYVKLDAMVEAVRPVLNANDLVLIQGADDTAPPKTVRVLTRLLHLSGQWVETSTEVPLLGRIVKGGGRADADAQAAGSAITYARRYGLASILGLTSDEDDDGNRASRGTRRRGFVDTPPAAEGATVLDEKLMPVGQHYRNKPIKDVPLPTLRQALAHCRDRNLKEEQRIIAAELTRRSLGGDTKSEAALRAAAAEGDDSAADELEERRLAKQGTQGGHRGNS